MQNSKKYLLGFDIGTSESKGTICDLKGKILDMQAIAHDLIIPKPCYMEHDPIQYWWEDFKIIVARLLEKTKVQPSEIVAIGCSAIACAVTPIDEKGAPLRNAILYGIDTRSEAEINELNQRIGEQKIFEHCGQALSADSFGPKILWIKNNEPEIFEKAKTFTFAQGYVNMKLTGKNYIDAYSAKMAEPLFDMETKDWNDGMCSYIVDKSKLPKIMWTTEVIGEVTNQAAKETGLSEGTPVICGTTDAAAEAVSVGVIEPGDLMLMYGSTLFIIQLSENEIDSEIPLWKSHFIFKDTYCVLSAMATSGSLVQWFRNTFAKDLMEKQKENGENAFTGLFEEIKNIPPGSEGVFVLPYFAGERMPIKDPHAKGMIFGLTLAHGRDNIFRAVIEGIGYGLKHNLDLLRSVGFDVDKAIAVGGGTKSKAWMQIMSDMSDCDHIVKEVSVGASYGDALLAGLGISAIKSRKELKELFETKYTVKPRVDNKKLYDKCFGTYKNLYIDNKEKMHRISENVK